MICNKCKHEMPDGIRYCGHCGRKMTVVEYVINWSFDKKRLPITLIALALVIGLLIWGAVSLISAPAGDGPGEMGDYGVFPLLESFIREVPMEELDRDAYPYMDNAVAIGFDEELDDLGSPVYSVWSSDAHWYGTNTINKEYADNVGEYLALLEQEPFCLELIHQETLDDGEWYFYRYTGTQQVYPLGPHSRIEQDLGECHVWIRVNTHQSGSMTVERWIGLGLEGICREEYDAILAGEAYQRRTDDMIQENFSG